jgi:hypothetical protein
VAHKVTEQQIGPCPLCDAIERAIQEAVEAEREACLAAVSDVRGWLNPAVDGMAVTLGAECLSRVAATIRARGKERQP